MPGAKPLWLSAPFQKFAHVFRGRKAPADSPSSNLPDRRLGSGKRIDGG
jgi:hypothetical protein